MENKLISIILFSIGFAILIWIDIGILAGVLFIVWAHHYWMKKENEVPCHPEEEVGGNEMGNDVSPITK